MRKNAAEPIGNVVKNVVEGLGHSKKSDAHKILSLWSGLVGRAMAQHSRPAGLARGRLLVNVDESAWLYQINLQKAKLLSAIQKKVGKQKVRELQFRIGKIN